MGHAWTVAEVRFPLPVVAVVEEQWPAVVSPKAPHEGRTARARNAPMSNGRAYAGSLPEVMGAPAAARRLARRLRTGPPAQPAHQHGEAEDQDTATTLAITWAAGPTRGAGGVVLALALRGPTGSKSASSTA